MSLSDVILVVAIELVLTRLVLFHLVEEYFAVNDRTVDIDDDVTIDYTTGVAAAIDVTTFETAIQVSISSGDRTFRRGA